MRHEPYGNQNPACGKICNPINGSVPHACKRFALAWVLIVERNAKKPYRKCGMAFLVTPTGIEPISSP